MIKIITLSILLLTACLYGDIPLKIKPARYEIYFRNATVPSKLNMPIPRDAGKWILIGKADNLTDCVDTAYRYAHRYMDSPEWGFSSDWTYLCCDMDYDDECTKAYFQI